MRMSDVVSSMGLAIFPVVALVLFLSVFIGVVLQVTRRNRRAELDGAAFLPLAEEAASKTVHTTRAKARAEETAR